MVFNLSTIIVILWVLAFIGAIIGIKKKIKPLWIPCVALFCINTAGTIWAWFDLYG